MNDPNHNGLNGGHGYGHDGYGRGPADPKSDRVEGLLDDIRQLVADSNRIVAHGQEAFFDGRDRTLRLAAKAIVIDLQTAAQRLPPSYRDRFPDVAWDELRAMRNYLAHDYAETDFSLVWNALAVDFPRLLTQLGVLDLEIGD